MTSGLVSSISTGEALMVMPRCSPQNAKRADDAIDACPKGGR